MTPEQQARIQIDQHLKAAGWIVQDAPAINLTAGPGIAVREFPLKTGFADYLLYAGGKAIGVVEAKPKGFNLTGVETQSKKYRDGLPKDLPHYRLPLPFAYESTGEVTRFTNSLEPECRSREVFSFHRPEELISLATSEKQLRHRLRQMPPLEKGRLWRVQVESINSLEKSLAGNRPRALIQMATGSGKTFTAVNFCYRLIKYAGAKRILFLVDRNNLGKQTLNEFQQFASPTTGYKFTEEYDVQHLKGRTISPSSKVCITTIQRLFAMVSNKDLDEENEEGSLFETDQPLIKEPVPVSYNPAIPIESFDFIVIDECHRSIYNLWRQVLDYFDAFLIGLTATPTKQTIGFFGGNLVQDYGHEQAVIDKVNVGFDVYTIETQITQQGATLAKEPGLFVPHRDRRTKSVKYRELDDDLTYTSGQLDRDVVNKNQIRLVIQTFRDKLPEIFPGRTEVPKTLFFAKTDQHAEDIVHAIRDEFGKGNDFCQKITSKSTGAKPEDLLSAFRNSYEPRIAVTVDMIATGTDVKSLECLVFMRNVKSLGYFEQMKGRGCRVVSADELQKVTPDAKVKDHFVIVDCVGVCEEEKSATKPLDREPTVPLDTLLDLASKGVVKDDLASSIAAKLIRLDQRLDADQRELIEQSSGGKSLQQISADLLASLDPDKTLEATKAQFGVADPTNDQIQKVEHDRMAEALKTFHVPALREAILGVRRSLDQVIDEQTPDVLLKAGYSAEALQKARSMLSSFKQFIETNRDEIEAIKILYSRPYRAGLRFKHIKDLAAKLNQAPFHVDPARPESLGRLWSAYELVEPGKVKGQGGRQLVDVIALVKHAIDPSTLLTPLGVTVEERYREWLGEKSKAGITFTADQIKWLDAIKNHIASSLAIEQDDLEEVPFNTIGGLGRAYELFGDTLAPILDELNLRLAA
ncbi:MAG: DEAD/DEAH box helicase family protein [Planctomycetia bacterium]